MELQEEKKESQSKIIRKKKNHLKNKNKSRPQLRLKRLRSLIIEDDEEEEFNDKNVKIIIDDKINKDELEKKIIPITKLSSLDPNLFDNEYIKDYKCISCGLIPSFETAEEAICCGYLFCGKCQKDYQDKKDGCPLCSSKIKTRKIKKFNKIFYKSFKNFLIRCPYKCDWIGAWADLESHLLKCELSYRYCTYKLVGCEFVDENKKVKEHENNNDKLHLELALKFIKDKNIVKNKLKFELGEICRIICHPHPLKYVINRDSTWICDGDRLELGCDNVGKILSRETPRYRCEICNFDLCDSCVEKYYKISI